MFLRRERLGHSGWLLLLRKSIIVPISCSTGGPVRVEWLDTVVPIWLVGAPGRGCAHFETICLDFLLLEHLLLPHHLLFKFNYSVRLAFYSLNLIKYSSSKMIS